MRVISAGPCQPASKVPTAGCEATSQPSSDALLGITGYCAWPACTDAFSTSRLVDTSTQHPSSFCISHTQSSHSHPMLTPSGRASYLVPSAHSLAIFILLDTRTSPRFFLSSFVPDRSSEALSPVLLPGPALACIAEAAALATTKSSQVASSAPDDDRAARITRHASTPMTSTATLHILSHRRSILVIGPHS